MNGHRDDERRIRAHSCREGRTGQLVMGILMVAVGAGFLADRLGYWIARDIWRYWPVILIAIGLAKLADVGEGRRRSGVWLLMLGGIFLMDTLELLEIHDSWPLFIVAAGIMMLWRAIAPPAARPPRGETPPAADAIGDRPGPQP